MTRRAADIGQNRGGTGTLRASCELTGQGYGAKFDTPAVVALPSHGKATQPVTLTCIYNGKTYSQTYKPANLSAQARASNAVGAGMLCLVCGAVVGVAGQATAGDGNTDAYGFDALRLEIW